MHFTTIAQAKRDTGLSYLGTVSQSAKTAKNEKRGFYTYTLYLAPAKQSGYEVCPARTPHCTAACLAFSGHNKIDKHGRIDAARIKKTRLYFEHRAFFVAWLFTEIENAQAKAKRDGFDFSVRLNATSDLSPESFQLNGVNVLNRFQDVQFYDYTKVAERIALQSKYSNYRVTFSYTGLNLLPSMHAIAEGANVAVVFEGKQLPRLWNSLPVVDGDESDLRFLDPPKSVVGLRFKSVRHKIKANPFIVSRDAKESVY